MLTERTGHNSVKGLGLKNLSGDDIDTIHFAACRILKTTGVKIEHKQAAELFSSGGALVTKEGENWRAYIPEWLISDSLASAPKSFSLGARNPKNNFYLERGRVGFSTFGEQVKVIDPYTREYRSSRREDARRIYKVVNALDGITVGSRTVCPNDLPEPVQQAHNFYDALTCTEKHVWMGLSNTATLNLGIEMVKAIMGETKLASTPINTVTACPTSPLVLVEMCCENIIGAAQSGVMNVEIMDMCLAGGTSPVTLAGTIVMTVAEQLSGLVLTQLARKGTNTLFGSCSSNMDLRTGLAPMASPENTLIASSVATMAGFYKIPIRTGGGVSDAKVPDAQAGYEYAGNVWPLALAGANIIWGAGGLDSGLGFDFAKLLMDHEFANNINFMLQGIPVNNEQLALELIEDVGPAASYLTQRHTFERARKQSTANLFERHPFGTWQTKGAKTLTEKAYEQAIKIIETHEPTPLPENVQNELDGLLREFVKKHAPQIL